MLRNYFITALRNIIRNKIQSFIQVLSLTIGITAFILIGLYAKYELSYDTFNEKFDRIYRLEFKDQVGLGTGHGHLIKQEIPEVGNVVRLVNWGGKDKSTPGIIPATDSTDERVVYVEDVLMCDSTIFDVFTFNFLQGDPKSALRDPNTCVMTESTARKFFGDRDPVGESFGEYTVTGIIEDVKNSHIEVNMLSSIVSTDPDGPYTRGEPEYLNNYHSFSYMTYLLLPERNDPSYAEKRINELFINKYQIDVESTDWGEGFLLRPLKDIYFSTNLKGEMNYCRHGNLKLLRMLLTIAAFILLLGIINYNNLTTARASLRAKEVGIRKLTGSSGTRLITQFLVEAILVALISSLIALTMVQLLLPGFNELASTELDMEFIDLKGTWMIYFISAIILGLISGIYPSVYLTSFQPVESLSGKRVQTSGSIAFRRALLSFQYIISIVLIIGVLVIFRQLKYMKTTELGFNKDLVINLEMDNRQWGADLSKQQLIRQQLLQDPNITGVTFSSNVMGGNQVFQTFEWEIEGVKKTPAQLQIDPDFFDVMEIKMLEGRNISWDRPGDYAPNMDGQTKKIIVNETFVHEFELKSPVGYLINRPNGQVTEIIGVVSDFNFKSQHEKIEPCWYYVGGWLGSVSIKISSADIQTTINSIKNVMESLHPDVVFDYSFLDETYARQYIKDEKTVRIISNFAVVAILIACLGLFGLSSFMAARRTKEIGIRKSMGASVQSVFLLLSQEFIKWIILSVVIACPLAWYIMNRWLQNFAYRTNISWWIFVPAILIAFAITFITVTWQSLKTARTNPVEALRYE